MEPQLSAANKARGSLYESQIEEYLNKEGVKARRLPRAGAKDIGDVAIELSNGIVLVVEAKNTKVASIPEFLRQADVEASHYEAKYDRATVGIVAMKARQKGIGETRIVLTLDRLLDLLRWSNLT